MANLKKVMMKSTTTLSINERFTYLRRNPEQSPVQRLRETNAFQQRASSKNRRLAQQMERRPAVMAALKIKKRTIRQRLGQPFEGAGGIGLPVRDRLSLPAARPTFRGGRGRLRGRGIPASRGGSFITNRRTPLNRSRVLTSIPTANVFRSQQAVTLRTFQRGRGNPRGQVSLAVGLRGRGIRRQRGVSVGVRRGVALRGQFRVGQLQGQLRGRGQLRGQARIQSRGFQLSRGGVQRGRGVQRGYGGVQQGRGGVQRGRGGVQRGRGGLQRGRFQRGRGVVGTTRGRAGFRGRRQGQQTHMSKEDLDKQLDQYMSSTRNHLDQELDTYMTDSWS